ncbi:hypothetical protein AKG37_11080 [Bacillus australimaris]|uniref:Uncharacterized protein n=1 Tax=Bacillus australimaris TaxID=1326968 RepID=A0ABR5MS53_9BACI|nr:hypothetical protein AKG37_11080 [Bacillus australimaris]
MIMIISFNVNHFLYLFSITKKAAYKAAQIDDKRLKCLLFTFQCDRKPLKSRKDEYRSGANCTFVSTGTQE